MTTGCNALDVRFLDRPNIKECWMCSRENHAEGVGILKQVFDVLKHTTLDAVSLRLFGDKKTVSEARILWDTEVEKAACPPDRKGVV